uniref:Uncharacterized protein n=1 Tax=Siphoviridae sp. ctWDo30 TaxID=2826360 RepID=A0A8S5N606_9CAUD|nr:MAG TPA: hypothetical protein [Siphoviridae sp. ctWDo30]
MIVDDQGTRTNTSAQSRRGSYKSNTKVSILALET